MYKYIWFNKILSWDKTYIKRYNRFKAFTPREEAFIFRVGWTDMGATGGESWASSELPNS